MHNLNTSLFTYVNHYANVYPTLDMFFVAATSYYFSVLAFIAVALYIAVYLPYKAQSPLHRLKRYGEAALAAVAIGFTEFIVWALKVTVAEGRPYTVLTNVHLLIHNTAPYASFPSGHAALTSALATSVYVYHKKLGALLFLLAAIVGLSRIFVGVHYPFDVFVGFSIGVLVPYLIHKAFAERAKKG